MSRPGGKQRPEYQEPRSPLRSAAAPLPEEGQRVLQDLHAGAAGRKFAGVVQLSQDDAYSGGDLLMRFAHHAVPMPRALGTLVAFPGWTLHEVTPIEAGERWSLCVNGWGNRLR